MAALTRSQRQLIAAFRVEAARVRRATAADLAGVSDEVRKIIVAQNVLRTCIEAAIDDSVPFSRVLPGDLAIRLASYAVSILPIAEQEAAVAAVCRSLPEAHRLRMKAGVTLRCDWGESAADAVPNVPERGDIH